MDALDHELEPPTVEDLELPPVDADSQHTASCFSREGTNYALFFTRTVLPHETTMSAQSEASKGSSRVR